MNDDDISDWKSTPPKIDIEPEKKDGLVQMFFRFSFSRGLFSGSILILQGVYSSFFNQPCGYICKRG